MAKNEIRVGDDGTTHEITMKDQDDVVLDLSAALTISTIYVRPDDTSFTKTGALVTDGTDGKFRNTFAAADLTIKGTYEWQVTVTFPQGTWRSDLHEREVHANLP